MSGSGSVEIFFQSDGMQLRGVLHEPNRPAPPFIVGSHGLFSDAASPKQVRLGETLSEKGIAYFRFDHRGCGKSDGDFVKVTSLEGRASDILNAIEMLNARKDLGPFLGLFGSSMGGAASLWVASRRAVPALVTVAAPLRSREIKGSDPDSNPDSLTRALLKRNSLHFDLSHNLPRIRNILLFHGDADETVPFSNALEIREKAENPKRLIRFEAGDHRMSNPVHQAIFIQEATEWFVQTAGSLS
ncbi:MAG: damage-inducible protein CinA [Desulfobacterales bacterium CG07_land_8_20_14_0_80_52_14]|nr:MAG: damage-inducible protein CinA [Desulfobacterales bacterium CG07_land_8_20_14_0_80_52_14]